MSIPTEIKIQFMEIVEASFGAHPDNRDDRLDWIREIAQFLTLSDLQMNFLITLSKTIHTLEKAESKLIELKKDRTEEREYLIKQQEIQLKQQELNQIKQQEIQSYQDTPYYPPASFYNTSTRYAMPAPGLPLPLEHPLHPNASMIPQLQQQSTTSIVGAQIKQIHNQFQQLQLQEGNTNIYTKIKSGRQSENFISWNQPLELFRNATNIMIRECYVKIYDLISKNLSSFKNHVVTGVPGIGKSTFCLYFIWRYINENPDVPILFESEYNRIHYLSSSISFATDRFNCMTLKFPYFVDFFQLKEPDREIGSFTIVFSSPDPLRFHQMLKDFELSTRYIMPVWKSEELFELNKILKVSEDQIFQRFGFVGGVPRLIFFGSWDDVMAVINNSLKEKGSEIAKHLFEEGFGMKDEIINYSLVHLIPEKNDGYCTRSNNYDFASRDIWKLLYSLHQNKILMKSYNYFNGGTGAYGGSFAGFHFEIICLHAIPIANSNQTIISLNNTNQSKIISIPSSQNIDLKREQIVFQQNILYIPTKKNFESADAFFLSNDNELFVLQITVAASHPVKANGLDKICQLIPDYLKESIEKYNLVFVVPSNGQLISCQTIATTKGETITRKSPEVAKFEESQWRLEYILPVPNTSENP